MACWLQALRVKIELYVPTVRRYEERITADGVRFAQHNATRNANQTFVDRLYENVSNWTKWNASKVNTSETNASNVNATRKTELEKKIFTCLRLLGIAPVQQKRGNSSTSTTSNTTSRRSRSRSGRSSVPDDGRGTQEDEKHRPANLKGDLLQDQQR